MVGLPYTGPEVTAAAVAMDKQLTKEILIARSIPTPRYFAISADAPRRRATPGGPGGDVAGIDWPAVLREGLRKFPLPWVLKPNCLGSSVGVVIARSEPELLRLASGVERFLPWASGGAPEQGGEILVEEFIEGRELTCGVIATEGSGPRALPPIEIRPVSSKFFDYEAKYTPGASEEICPAPIPPALTREVQDMAIAVHRAVRADPLSRTDFILDPHGKLHVLEINTIPGMTATSLIPLSAGKAGIDLGDLLRSLVEHALRRAGR
jgi:D-alanine-D-alanine ligase